MSRIDRTPKASFVVAFLFMAGACVLQPSLASAGAPTEALQVTSQKARLLLGDRELKKPEHRAERHSQLVTIIGERFSCEEMSKRALGEEWAKHSGLEREEFIRLFQILLAKSYASKIEGYAGAPIHYLKERLGNGHAVVSATIYAVKNDYAVDFWLVETAGDWLVYDVVVDGISLITSYKRQFARVLTYASYETLVERMREKANEPVRTRTD